VILAGEDGADVYLNGVKYRRQTSRGGQLRIPREPAQYSRAGRKPGFEEAPEQTIALAKGDEKKVVFKLVAPAHHRPPRSAGRDTGRAVCHRQTLVGTVQPDGSFQEQTISPAEHSIELRKGKTKIAAGAQEFAAARPSA